jgi:glycogen synthase kinase 3 beta
MWPSFFLPNKEQRSCSISAGIRKKNYRIIKRLGKGAFGTVYQARWLSNNHVLAVKETFQDPKFVNREGDISKLMDHENVVKFLDVSYVHRNGKKYLILVMDYYPHSLQDVINQMSRLQRRVNAATFKTIALSIFRGLEHIHSKSIAHRDIKPDNILVNLNEGKVVIADLGSAKPINDGSYNKSYICSRIYRAPELVVGCQNYTYGIDIWSAGCVLLEILLLTPLFPARSNDHLLALMQKFLGKLTEDQITRLKEGIVEGEPVKVQNTSVMEKVSEHTQQCGGILTQPLMELLSRTLQWDPQIRIGSKDAVEHAYFIETQMDCA